MTTRHFSSVPAETGIGPVVVRFSVRPKSTFPVWTATEVRGRSSSRNFFDQNLARRNTRLPMTCEKNVFNSIICDSDFQKTSIFLKLAIILYYKTLLLIVKFYFVPNIMIQPIKISQYLSDFCLSKLVHNNTEIFILYFKFTSKIIEMASTIITAASTYLNQCK